MNFQCITFANYVQPQTELDAPPFASLYLISFGMLTESFYDLKYDNWVNGKGPYLKIR
jgi:hypothetical protein